MIAFQDNFDDTLVAAAEIMHRLRPDIYTVDYAKSTLSSWINDLKDKSPGSAIGSGGFQLVRTEEFEGSKGYELVMHLVDFNFDRDPDGDITPEFNGAVWRPEWALSPLLVDNI